MPAGVYNPLNPSQNKIVWLISAEEDWVQVTEEKVTENAVDELTRRYNKVKKDWNVMTTQKMVIDSCQLSFLTFS